MGGLVLLIASASFVLQEKNNPQAYSSTTVTSKLLESLYLFGFG